MAFDPTKPVQTRDGWKARIICTDRKHIDGTDGTIVALIRRPDGPHASEELIRIVYANGCYRPQLDTGRWVENSFDLVNVPETFVTWQAVLEHGCGTEYPDDTYGSINGREKWLQKYPHPCKQVKGWIKRTHDKETRKCIKVEFEEVT